MFSRTKATFVGHEACPKCRERGKDNAGNNFARYSDGAGYCFSCRYWEPRKGGIVPQKSPAVKGVGDIFGKLSGLIPIPNMAWLSKYLERDEIYQHFKWSAATQRHVYTLGGYAEGRSINPKETKVISVGHKPFVIFGDITKVGNLVLTEDVVSAIVVSRVWPAMPLFGSTLSMKAQEWLCENRLVDRVYIWLDPDKRGEAISMEKRLNSVGLPAECIFTTVDPKDHTTEEVQTKLYGVLQHATDSSSVSL